MRLGRGLPEIDLYDVRHSYATAGRDAKIAGRRSAMGTRASLRPGLRRAAQPRSPTASAIWGCALLNHPLEGEESLACRRQDQQAKDTKR